MKVDVVEMQGLQEYAGSKAIMKVPVGEHLAKNWCPKLTCDREFFEISLFLAFRNSCIIAPLEEKYRAIREICSLGYQLTFGSTHCLMSELI